MSKYKIKKPEFTATELNSNIVYGMTSVNNINQDELDSIQWLCEKSMNDDIKITYLQSQLAEKDKEIEKLKLDNKKYFTDSCRANKEISYKLKQQNQKAIEQLEKVKETTECVLDSAIKNSSLNQSYYDRLLDEIDKQIKQLKEIK